MVATDKREPYLIGVDWGSSCLRIYLISHAGEVLATRSSAQGCSSMNGSASAYQHSLQQLAGDWLEEYPEIELLACGMVGSKHGWQEVPYLTCPAGEQEIAAGVMTVTGDNTGDSSRQRLIKLVPGMAFSPANAAPDVMRGEETQVIGALTLRADCLAQSCLILPGTHSKWVHIENGKVTAFSTHMTGELFALLSQHSVLGRLMPQQKNLPDPIAFARGVEDARKGMHLGLGHQLFAVRTLGLMEILPPASLSDYLSGLLIGHEIQAGLIWRQAAGLESAPLLLLGDAALCGLYAQALSHCGVGDASILSNTAAAGLWAIARHTEQARLKLSMQERTP